MIWSLLIISVFVLDSFLITTSIFSVFDYTEFISSGDKLEFFSFFLLPRILFFTMISLISMWLMNMFVIKDSNVKNKFNFKRFSVRILIIFLVNTLWLPLFVFKAANSEILFQYGIFFELVGALLYVTGYLGLIILSLAFSFFLTLIFAIIPGLLLYKLHDNKKVLRYILLGLILLSLILFAYGLIISSNCNFGNNSSCLVARATSSIDISGDGSNPCEKGRTDKVRDTCYMELVKRENELSENFKICNIISNPQERTNCVEQSIWPTKNQTDISVCNILIDVDRRRQCQKRIGNNACSYNREVEYTTCITDLAILYDDPFFCGIIKSVPIKNCYRSYTDEKLKSSPVSYIPTDLILKNVKERDGDPRVFDLDICVEGSKSIMDLKQISREFYSAVLGYFIYKKDGSTYTNTLDWGGEFKQIKNGQCTKVTAYPSAYGDLSYIIFSIDPNNFIGEINRENNSLRYYFKE